MEQAVGNRLGFISELRAALYDAAGKLIKDYGIVGRRLVTDAGINFLRDAWLNSDATFGTMNFHASGTGVAAEAASDTALGTEVATRTAGTKSSPATKQFRSVGTITYGGAFTISEHGLFSQLAVGGTLWDRTLLATPIAVVGGQNITFTYTCTFTGS